MGVNKMKKLISFFTIFNVMGTRKMYPRFFYKISNKGKKEYKFLYRINYNNKDVGT